MIKSKSNIYVIVILVLSVSIASVGTLAASHELSLEEALILGMENNVGLREVKHDQNIAEIDLNSAKKAFYPEVSISSTYTKLSKGPSIPSFDIKPDPEPENPQFPFEFVTTTMEGPTDNYQTSISLQQPIYLGGKIWLGMEQAEKGLDAADMQILQKKNELYLQIIQSYYNVLLAEERVNIEEDALELVREHRKTTESGLSAGVTLKTDLLQVEIEEGGAVQSLAVARNDLMMAKKVLGNTIGMDLLDRDFSWPSISPSIELEKNLQVELARGNRPELELLELNEEILEINLKMEENSHLPNIVLQGNYQWQGDELRFEDGTGSLTLALSMNIFDRGLSQNREDKLQEDLAKLNLNKSNLEELMEIEIEELILTIEESRNNIKLQQLNLKKAEENLELETKRYQAGMGTNINVMNAQLMMKQTRIALMQAEYQHKINLFKLLQKTGRLIEFCEGEIINE
ncbi:MAG: TolC family protein [Halanaerobiales bacterium]